MTDKDKKPSPLSDDTIRRMKEDVGYGRPPVHSRFQKGQSGNPKGRPRSTHEPNLSIADLPTLGAILESGQQKVTAREGDKVSELPVPDVLARSILATALKGDPRAQRLMLHELRAAEERKAIEVQAAKALACSYKDDAYQQLDAARAAGKPPPPIYPHPDDVVLDDDTGFHVIGPADADEQRKLQQTLHIRDILLLQDELDQRLWSAARPGSPGGALLMAVALEHTIPERYRLNELEIGLRACRHQAMTKRALLKALYGAWKTLGVPVKRGWVFPSGERVAEMLAFGGDLIGALRDGRVSAQGTRRGKLDAETERYLQDWAERIERAP